jgi:hypothetical protein
MNIDSSMLGSEKMSGGRYWLCSESAKPESLARVDDPKLIILPFTELPSTSQPLSHIDMLARAASRLSSARVGLPKSRKIHSSSKPKAIPFWPSSKLASEDSQLVNNQAYKTARAKFNVVASKDAFAKTQKALQEKGHEVTVVKDKAAALKTLQNLIPDGASINLAGSTSLVRPCSTLSQLRSQSKDHKDSSNSVSNDKVPMTQTLASKDNF